MSTVSAPSDGPVTRNGETLSQMPPTPTTCRATGEHYGTVTRSCFTEVSHFPHCCLTSRHVRISIQRLTAHGNSPLRYLFENYVLDTEVRELRRGQELVPLTPQAFDLLEYLIRNRDRVVSKDDLIGTIWGGRAISDSALTTRLNVARRLVQDSGGEQRLIKTLSRKGVRFVGTVREECLPERTNSAP